jgi:hypothetical protein
VVDDKFWEVIKKFNILMQSAIIGPNCLEVCNGDCCSIKIDVPKILAEEYIKRGYSKKKDFIRSDVFSFKLRFDEEKGKCFLFDKNFKGCLVHTSGIKPPQCWIYPTNFATNFSDPKHRIINCKKATGWEIINPEQAKEAEELLGYYVFLCQLEAKNEVKAIKDRLNDTLAKKSLEILLKSTPPRQLAGFKDTWDCITTLSAQGVSLQMKKFCKQFNKECDLNYMECESICDKIIDGLLKFLQERLFKTVQKEGPDGDGAYPFFKLV